MLQKWSKLTELRGDTFSRGDLIKFPAEYPFEGEVVMMLSEAPYKDGLCLITITGHKAGINCFQKLPELVAEDTLAADWLITNWNEWIWPEGDVNQVFIHKVLQVTDLDTV